MRESDESSGAKPRRSRRWLRRTLVAAAALPVVALGAPESVRIPKVKEHPSTDPPDAALFSHWSHSEFSCFACHPSIFPKRRKGFTHADMKQGRFCGACHNGERAWSPGADGVDCETCHVPKKEQRETDEDIFD